MGERLLRRRVCASAAVAAAAATQRAVRRPQQRALRAAQSLQRAGERASNVAPAAPVYDAGFSDLYGTLNGVCCDTNNDSRAFAYGCRRVSGLPFLDPPWRG
jgi:hypothetical protein